MKEKPEKPTQPIKWHGGKHYLASRIIELFPPRTEWCHYVEPYFGGGSVLLANDPEGISEVANDINCELTIFWRVLSSESHFSEFLRLAQATPFSEPSWREAGEPYDLKTGELSMPAAVSAANFFIRCRQSLAGRMDSFAPLSRNRVRRGMNEQASAWLNAVDGLPAVHARLRRVVILNRPALEVIRQQDGPKTLFYLDPPYLHETRVATDAYQHEMTEEQHAALLGMLSKITGRFLLSGYPSKLYDAVASAAGWKRHDFDLPNNSAGGSEKRRMTECVWTNY